MTRLPDPALLLHPLRLRIVQALLNQPPQPPRALLEQLPDVAPATLYRHLKLLTDAGILRVASERPVRGVTERSYALGGGSVGPTPDSLLHVDADEQFRFFAHFVATLLNQYAAYLAGPAVDLLADGVGFSQVAVHASDAEFQDTVQQLSAVLDQARRRAPEGRRRRLITTVLVPDDHAA